MVDRQQFVNVTHFGDGAVNKINSECACLNLGVLNPILFLVYVNDFYKTINDICATMYADDTSILLAKNNLLFE